MGLLGLTFVLFIMVMSLMFVGGIVLIVWAGRKAYRMQRNDVDRIAGPRRTSPPPAWRDW